MRGRGAGEAGEGGERGESKKDKNTKQKQTTCASVPQPLNRAMVYDYLA